MTREQMIAAVVAAVALAWPKIVSLWQAGAAKLKGGAPAPAGKAVGFEEAIHNLAVVRVRLVASNLLDEQAKKAIDTLTLQLVAGSDQ
jgi:hypothetical protein